MPGYDFIKKKKIFFRGEFQSGVLSGILAGVGFLLQ